MLSLLPYAVLMQLIFITTFNRGFFTIPGFFITTTAYISLSIIIFLHLIKKRSIDLPPGSDYLIRILLVFVYTLYLFFLTGIYQTGKVSTLLLIFLPPIFYPLVISYVLPKYDESKRSRLRFILLIILALALRFLIIIASPQPAIDTYYDQKEAPMALVRGLNPYSLSYTKVYSVAVKNVYGYWPVSLFLQVPFIVIFNDPRILHTVADIIGAILIYFIGKKTKSAEIFSLIYLFRPNSIFIIEQSWLTPTIFFVSALLIYAYISDKMQKRNLLIGGLVGCLVGIQLLYLLFLPLILPLIENKKRFLVGFLMVILLSITPFLIWNFRDFYADTIGYYLSLNQQPEVPIYMSLNLNTVFHTFTNKNLPSYLMPTLIILITSLLVYIFHKSFMLKQTGYRQRVSSYLLAVTFIFFTFYYFSSFAFINHYYYISGLYILAIVSMINGKKIKPEKIQ